MDAYFRETKALVEKAKAQQIQICGIIPSYKINTNSKKTRLKTRRYNNDLTGSRMGWCLYGQAWYLKQYRSKKFARTFQFCPWHLQELCKKYNIDTEYPTERDNCKIVLLWNEHKYCIEPWCQELKLHYPNETSNFCEHHSLCQRIFCVMLCVRKKRHAYPPKSVWRIIWNMVMH